MGIMGKSREIYLNSYIHIQISGHNFGKKNTVCSPAFFVMTTKGLVKNIRHFSIGLHMGAALYCIKRYRTSSIDSIKGKCHHNLPYSLQQKNWFTTKPMRSLQIFPQFRDQKGGTNKEASGFIELCC